MAIRIAVLQALALMCWAAFDPSFGEPSTTVGIALQDDDQCATAGDGSHQECSLSALQLERRPTSSLLGETSDQRKGNVGDLSLQEKNAFVLSAKSKQAEIMILWNNLSALEKPVNVSVTQLGDICGDKPEWDEDLGPPTHTERVRSLKRASAEPRAAFIEKQFTYLQKELDLEWKTLTKVGRMVEAIKAVLASHEISTPSSPDKGHNETAPLSEEEEDPDDDLTVLEIKPKYRIIKKKSLMKELQSKESDLLNQVADLQAQMLTLKTEVSQVLPLASQWLDDCPNDGKVLRTTPTTTSGVNITSTRAPATNSSGSSNTTTISSVAAATTTASGRSEANSTKTTGKSHGSSTTSTTPVSSSNSTTTNTNNTNNTNTTNTTNTTINTSSIVASTTQTSSTSKTVTSPAASSTTSILASTTATTSHHHHHHRHHSK